MPYDRKEITQKLNGIYANAEEAAIRRQTKTFQGFPLQLAQRFNASLQVDDVTTETIRDRIAGPLRSMANKFGMTFMFAGEDFPVHMTVQEGVYDGEDQPASLFAEIGKEVAGIVGCFTGTIQTLNTLLLDSGGNIIVAANPIEDKVFDVRQQLKALYEKYGLKPLPLDNLWHSTMGRLTSLPEDKNKKARALGRLWADYEVLKMKIEEDPIRMRIEKTYVGDAFSFFVAGLQK